MPSVDNDLELEPLHRPPAMEEEETEALNENLSREEDPIAAMENDGDPHHNNLLDRRVRRKLDCILLPFLAILFLLNSMDKSNIGNAETAGFTTDAGLAPEDLNTSMAFFFAFFVTLQPIGAAFGRKFGMARWVPACMSLWGLCTLLHMWVRAKWQLIVLRIAIASLEAGFYPTTVSYLSLFYTRYEFAVRLGFFYGQTAVAGVIAGILSWAVFSRFEKEPGQDNADGFQSDWKAWEVLFLIEGCLTMAIAFVGFWWLPHSADTAWFFNAREKRWAEQRIRLDFDKAANRDSAPSSTKAARESDDDEVSHGPSSADAEDEESDGEVHHRLLSETETVQRTTSQAISITADAGLTRQDILSAVCSYNIWHILVCNILSAIPATAFGVFLPMVMKQLSPTLNLSPSASNLLSAPPFAFGALMLFVFTSWSDRSRRRLIPIFWGLALLLFGLTTTVLLPMRNYVWRYIALCILLSGSFIASPLTVAWLANNTPEPGKRAILLGINGWGNLAGVFLLVLFTPDDKKNGYIRSFIITLLCALASFAGYVLFWILLRRENAWRDKVTSSWNEEERERERIFGDMPIPTSIYVRLQHALSLDAVLRRLGLDEGRKGDEKITFTYGL